jgi:hypothetical protein
VNGQASFTVRDAVGESVIFTARDTTDSVTLSQTVAVSFLVSGVTISTSPVSVTAGQPGTNAAVTITPVNGFTGTVTLSLACTPPAELTITLPGAMNVSSATQVLIPVSAAAAASGGTYNFSLSAKNNSNTTLDTKTLAVTVHGWGREYIRLGGRMISIENPVSGCGR